MGMRGVNVWHGYGFLGRDPELRRTNGGKAVCNFSLGVPYGKKKSDGSFEDVVDFFEITAWGTTAENCARYLKKGSKIVMTGKLQPKSWENKGVEQRSVTIHVMELSFVPDGKGGGQAEASRTGTTPPPSGGGGFGSDDDDIPF